MEQYALYLVMKKKVLELSNKFTCSFNDMDFNKPNVIGIYIKSGGTPSERALSDGGYYNYRARVQFIIQGDNSKQSLMDVLDIASSLRNTLSLCSNSSELLERANCELTWYNDKIVYDPTHQIEGYNILVTLCEVSLLGEVDFKGKSGQGLPKYSINFIMEYFTSKGGN